MDEEVMIQKKYRHLMKLLEALGIGYEIKYGDDYEENGNGIPTDDIFNLYSEITYPDESETYRINWSIQYSYLMNEYLLDMNIFIGIYVLTEKTRSRLMEVISRENEEYRTGRLAYDHVMHGIGFNFKRPYDCIENYPSRLEGYLEGFREESLLAIKAVNQAILGDKEPKEITAGLHEYVCDMDFMDSYSPKQLEYEELKEKAKIRGQYMGFWFNPGTGEVRRVGRKESTD